MTKNEKQTKKFGNQNILLKMIGKRIVQLKLAQYQKIRSFFKSNFL